MVRVQNLEERQDEICARILMSIVRADGKILVEEIDLVASFFVDELNLGPERLRRVQELVVKLVHSDVTGTLSEDSSELPEAARQSVFDYGIRIAIVDGDLAPEERSRLLQLCLELGFSQGHFESVLRQCLKQARDAFSVLELPPTADWKDVEESAALLRQRYAPSVMAELGVAFQNLALEKLEVIEWAYQLLKEVLAEDQDTNQEDLDDSSEVPQSLELSPAANLPDITVCGDGVVFSRLPLVEPLCSQLWRRSLETEGQLRSYLAGEHKHFHAKTRALLEKFLQDVERVDFSDEQAVREGLAAYLEESLPKKNKHRQRDLPPVFPESVADNQQGKLQQLEEAIFQLFADDERLCEILCDRCGLRGHVPQTLESIGQRMGVTRERIRQLEKKGLLSTRNLLLHGSSKKLALHPGLLEFSLAIHRSLTEALFQDVTLLEDFQEKLPSHLARSPLRRGLLRLYMDWNGLWIEAFDDARTFIYRHQSSANRAAFSRYLRQVESFLSRSPGELHLRDLPQPPTLEGFSMTSDDIIRLLDFELEWTDDEVFQVPLAHLKSRTDQAERVLRESGEGLDFREIARRIREAEEDESLNDSNLRNQMITDDRFKPIGRSGVWILSKWTHLTTATIPEVLQKILSGHEGLTLQELFEEVQSLRPCSENSIQIIVSADPQFVRVGPDKYTYRPGASAAEHWNREGLGSLVEEFFRDESRPIVPFKELKQALAEKVAIDEQRLSLLLAHNPSVVTSRDRSGRLHARLRENWREFIGTKRRIRRSPSLQERVDNLLRETLSASPSEALLDIVNFFSEELGSPVSSLYTYVRDSKVCESFEDNGVKRLRLTATHSR